MSESTPPAGDPLAPHWAEAEVGGRRAGYLGNAAIPDSWAVLDELEAWPGDAQALVADLHGPEHLTRLVAWLKRCPERVHVAVRSHRGGPLPRALAEHLRPFLRVDTFRSTEAGLTAIGETDAPDPERWQTLASPSRLLELTEAALDAERRAAAHEAAQTSLQLRQTVRNIVQTGLQRQTESHVLSKELGTTKARLASAHRSTRMRLGNAMMLATKHPLDTLRLPKRVLRLYRERGGQSQADEIAASELRARNLEAALDAFLDRIREQAPERLVFLFSGTTFIQPLRANRPIRMARLLLDRGVPVYFSYHGFLGEREQPSFRHPELLETPVDFTKTILDRLARADLGQTKKILLVSYPHFSVARHLNVFNASGWSSIYDCRDDWEAFQEVGAAPWYAPSVERFVVNNCDASFCVSGPLRDKIAQMTRHRPVRVSPNGYDPAFLSDGYARRPGAKIKVGYFGHLSARWFDWPAVARIARARPHMTFEIIGHLGPDKVDVPDNVVRLGPKTHAEICEYAAEWHAAIIPFRVGELADAVDPIKIYEYFALGLPVVSFRMPQIDTYPYTTTVTSTDAFVAALDEAVTTTPDPEVLQAFLSDNTWSHRVDQLLDAADDALAHPSVVKSFHPLREPSR